MFDQITYYIIGALGFIVAFGLAVFIHELGHFLAAKAFKVPVKRFVIGFDKEAMGFMPRCIWERKIGETVYGLSIVPLGGYVMMSGSVHPDLEAFFDENSPAPKGEQSEEKKTESLVDQALGDQEALYKKPFWQKTIIFAAGVVMNILLAMGIIAFMSWNGVTQDAPLPAVVGWQNPNSPFVAAGFQQGDQIVAINGTAISTDSDFYTELGKIIPIEKPKTSEPQPLPLTYTLKRGEETLQIPLELDLEKQSQDLAMLISMPAYVDYVMVNQAANKAGIREGDLFVAIDGEQIDDRNEAMTILRASNGKELTVELKNKAGELRTVKMTPRENVDQKGQGIIGVVFGNSEKITERKPIGEALLSAPLQTYRQVARYVDNLRGLGVKLLHGEIKSVRENLGGPVAITQLAGYHANLGLERFLGFLIALNVALAVMNILPIPLLDGGHIVLAAYEGLFGKPVPAKVLVPILNGAIYLLLGFVLLVSLSDVLKLFR